jgi:hypothetical protein
MVDDFLAGVSIGLAGGFSSGLIGVSPGGALVVFSVLMLGGGLATTVGLSAALGVPQRRAQMASLTLALIPTTAPAVWIYWREGAMASAPALLGVVLGLIAGTDSGAGLANRINHSALRATLIAFVSAMAAYMAYKALG